MTVWFTADWHLSHNNIIDYCHRPIETVKDMDALILCRFLESVKPNDTVYFLGDMTWRDSALIEAFQRMPKLHIHFIMGNHDKGSKKLLEKYCESVSDLKTIGINGQTIVVCHYAMRTWNKSHHGSWQLHGHSHGSLKPQGYQLDVGVDNHSLYICLFSRNR